MAKQFAIFALTFVALFALSFTFLAMVDALPEPLTTEVEAAETQPEQTESAILFAEAPTRITARSIGMDNQVLNPISSDIATLDEALLKGTIRHPQSAMLGVDGTVLLFGHSSYLPIVRNQNYKAFNGIQKLKQGEVVSVYSATTEYRYTVSSVRLANAEEDVVELPSNGKYLTLITCDTFGKKASRFIVTAEFAGAYAL
jgi:LPXTG-site transpeptidase (sortase) family protein